MHRMRLVATTITALLACTPLHSQETEPSVEVRVDEVFARWDTTNSPGCAVAVVKDGTIAYSHGYGMANLDHDVPIRTDTVFHVASVSKEFTAASIALLALEGALSLDDPIQQYLSWVPDFGQKITIRNLVHHNSGMRDQWSLLGMAGWRYSLDRITNADVEYLIKRQQDLNFAPGEQFLYSNTGYTLLGQIVEKVSGQSLREFTTERIFTPLGMTRTHFRDDFSEIVKDQAFGYRWNNDTTAFHTSVTNFDTVGATSLLTTVEDMARWDQNFIDPVVGGQAFLDLMHQRGKLGNGEEQDYAFGLTHGVYRGLRTVGHGGADAGYRSSFVRFPDQGYSIVTLCNLAQTNPGRLARDIADIYLEGQLDPVVTPTVPTKPVVLTAEQIARIEGNYWSESRAIHFEFTRHQDALQLRINGQLNELLHAGEGVFHAGLGRMIRFEPASGAVERMLDWSVRDESNTMSSEKLAPTVTDEESLQDFAGDYRSPELPVPYHIELGEGTLSISWLKKEPVDLTHIADDLLVGVGVGGLRFRRDASGRIAGFSLDAGRVKKVRFDRVP